MLDGLLKDEQKNHLKQISNTRNLFLGLVIAVVSILGGGIGSFYWFGQKITHNTQEKLLAIAQLKANQIEQWINERQSDALIFTSRPSVITTLQAIEKGIQDDNSQQQRLIMQQEAFKTRTEYGYHRIVLIDRAGRLVWQEGQPANLTELVTQTFQAKLRTPTKVNRFEFVDMHWQETSTGKMAVYGVLVPIYDQTNTLIGAAYLESDPTNYLFPLLRSWPTTSATAETFLVRQEGNLARYLNPLRHRDNAGLEFTRSLDQTGFLSVQAIKTTQKQKLLSRLSDYRNISVIGASQRIKNTPWVMVAKIDLSEADEPLQQLAIIVSSLTGLLIGIVFYVAYQIRRLGGLALQSLKQKAETEQALMVADNASRYLTAIETSIDGYAMLDRFGKFKEVNAALTAITDYSNEQLLERSIFDLVVTTDIEQNEFTSSWIAHQKTKICQQWKQRSGNLIDVQISISYFPQGEGLFFVFVQDITNQIKLQHQLERTTQLHRFLSRANEAIVRIREPQELLLKICEIASDYGKFRLVWIGIVNPETLIVETFAAAGEAINYIQEMQISIDPSLPTSLEPTGIAIRDNQIVVVNDYFTDPKTLPWHSQAQKHGISGSTAFPLVIDQQNVGAIVFYASEKNFFDDIVVNLLTELTEDVGLSLRLTDSEKRRATAEREIQEHAFLFRSQFDVGVLGIAISSIDKRWLRVNHKLSEMLGYSETELCNMSWTEMTHTEDLASNLGKFQRLLNGEIDGYEMEKRFIRKDGSLVYTILNVSCYRNADHSVKFLISSFQDITTRKQAAIALQNSEERFRLAIVNAPFPIILYSRDNQPLQINRAWINQTGFTDCDITEITEWTDRFCQNYLPLLQPSQNHTSEHDSPTEVKEINITTYDGSTRVWQFNSAYLSSIIDSQQMIIGVATDITEQKIVAQALQESEERLSRAITDAPLPIIIHAEDGQIIQINRTWTEITGYTLAEIPTIGDWVAKVFRDNYQEILRKIQNLYEITEQCDDGEFEIFTKDGSRRIWNFATAPLGRIADGRRALISMAMDVTDRKANEIALKEAKQQAEEANQAKSTFLANMSHELRTPLNGILGYAQVFARDVNLTPKQKEGLEIISQCGKHLLSLISEILDLSKIEAHHLDLNPSVINFPKFLMSVAKICQIKAEEKSLLFNHEFSEDLPVNLLVDEQRLRQILLNLLGNAIKFTDHGMVTLRVEVVPVDINNPSKDDTTPHLTKILFAVIDTGKGIAPEHLDKIFQPFEQVGDFKKRPEGTGLGLSITQKLVSMMGGNLQVSSKINRGSSFWFSLDLAEIKTRQPIVSNIAIADSPNIIGYTGRRITILVVDDRWANRAVIKNLLEPLGFIVLEAENGYHGILMAKNNSVDVIIADLAMPEMNGIEMVRQLRQMPKFQNIPILALSASIVESEKIRSINAGCDDFLAKPIDLSIFLGKIQEYLHLSWIYNQSAPKQTSDTMAEQLLIIPPFTELAAILSALGVGDFEVIAQEAQRISQLDPQYQSFADRLLSLVQAFDEPNIFKLLQSRSDSYHV
jgi:PAS domain S-box-containing protein